MRNGATIAFAVLLSACGVHQESSLQDQTASPFTKLGKVPNSMGILARTSDRLINIGDGKYAASADSGITWSTEFPYSTPLWFEEGGTLSVANGVLYKATGSTLYLSKDQGASFQKPKTDGYCTSRTIRALPDSSLIFASNCGVLISDDQGRSFYAKTTENGLSGNTILDVISHQDTLFALVQNYYRTLNVSRDSGETWTTFDVNQTLKGSISAPYIGENEKGVYIAANGFFQSKDQGQTFTKLTEASFTAFAVAGDTIVGTTESGDIYLSSDSGITWAIRRIDGVQKAAAKVIIVDQNIYLFTRPDSSSNYFIFSNDNGITFQTSQFPTITGQINQITDIASAYGKVWVLTETASYISEDGGHTLNRLNTGVTVRAFTRITQSGNKVFVEAGCYGSSQTCTFVSSDGGKSYSYLRDSGI
ncbi:MAG TPA: hypothetical protein VFO10_13820, partial [Oligoflexus sp.]|uniref:WD40/YVTN/BNR-like repeat-containing protein n=1 Tax=Oligoflexus sp. TaxID=1971216 RepID=UPI002D7E7E37